MEDAQRAVRFVRHNAKQYGINPDRIGGVGGSSGGHLVSLLGTLDGKGDPQDPDPIDRESSRLQCVVAAAAPSDLAKIKTETGLMAVTSFVGIPLRGANPATAEHKAYREVSPVTHVSADDAPFLLIHGDADRTVPFEQSELMEAALKKSGVEVKLIPVPGGGHGRNFEGATDPPDYLGETVRWLNRHLGVSREAAIVHAQSAVTGKWQGKTKNGFEIVLDLTATETALTGTLTRNGQTARIADGKVSKNTFTFKATLGDQTEGFTGEVAGDEITVWMDRQGPSRAAVLNRVKPIAAKAAALPPPKVWPFWRGRARLQSCRECVWKRKASAAEVPVTQVDAFPQGLKPLFDVAFNGTAEAVPSRTPVSPRHD